MPNAPTMNDLYLERIYLLEHAYNEERDRADAAEAERDALRDALRPFAVFAAAYLAKLRAEQAAARDTSIVYQFNDVAITVGMLRAARAALEPAP